MYMYRLVSRSRVERCQMRCQIQARGGKPAIKQGSKKRVAPVKLARRGFLGLCPDCLNERRDEEEEDKKQLSLQPKARRCQFPPPTDTCFKRVKCRLSLYE